MKPVNSINSLFRPQGMLNVFLGWPAKLWGVAEFIEKAKNGGTEKGGKLHIGKYSAHALRWPWRNGSHEHGKEWWRTRKAMLSTWSGGLGKKLVFVWAITSRLNVFYFLCDLWGSSIIRNHRECMGWPKQPLEYHQWRMTLQHSHSKLQRTFVLHGLNFAP